MKWTVCQKTNLVSMKVFFNKLQKLFDFSIHLPAQLEKLFSIAIWNNNRGVSGLEEAKLALQSSP